jgi:hypothetical protein
MTGVLDWLVELAGFLALIGFLYLCYLVLTLLFFWARDAVSFRWRSLRRRLSS